MLRGIDEFLLEAKKVIGCESVVDDVQIETDDFPVAFPVIRDNFLTSWVSKFVLCTTALMSFLSYLYNYYINFAAVFLSGE